MQEPEGVQTKVKQELSLCAACMSRGRRLSTLKPHTTNLFVYLLGQYASLVRPDDMLLCWECCAVLKRFCRFQHQVQAAQIVMMQTLNPEDENIQSFSTLVTTDFGAMACLPTPTILNASFDTSHVSAPLLSRHLTIDGKKVKFDPIKIPDEEKDQSLEEDCKKKLIETETEPKEEFMPNCTEGNETVDSSEDVIDDEADQEENNSQIEDESSPVKMKRTKMKFSEYMEVKKNPEIELSKCSEWFRTCTLTSEEAAHGAGSTIPVAGAGRHARSCRACRIPFATSLDYHRHNTFWHVLNEKSNGPFKCEECNEPCADKEALRLHWTVHNTVLRCVVCQQAVFDSEVLPKHLKRHSRVYTCSACQMPSAIFHTYRDFYYHCRDLHTKYLCDHCGTVRRSKAKLANHMRTFHDPEMLKRKEAPELRYCVECNKEFRNVKAYRNHVKFSKLHNPQYKKAKKGDPASHPCKQQKNPTDRAKIIELHQQGYKLAEIARELKMSRATIRRWVRRYESEGSLEHRPPRVRLPDIFTPDRARDMVQAYKEQPCTPTRVFAERYNCCLDTVRRALRRAGIKLKKP